jgi:hypothetical protein
MTLEELKNTLNELPSGIDIKKVTVDGVLKGNSTTIIFRENFMSRRREDQDHGFSS